MEIAMVVFIILFADIAVVFNMSKDEKLTEDVVLCCKS